MKLTTIDTRLGTDSTFAFSNGNTLPLTGVPFAMNYLSVQTTPEETSWWFNPQAHTYCGIRLTHQPSPWIGDFQHFTMQAQSFKSAEPSDYDATKATFAPHLITIQDITQNILTQACATTYGGCLQFQSIDQNAMFLKITAPKMQIHSFTKSNLCLSFQNFADCEDPEFTMYLSLALPASSDLSELAIVDDCLFIPLNCNQTQVYFATSFISEQQATLNLKPLLKQNFEELCAQSQQAWQEKLAVVEIYDQNQKNVSTFYHNLYRALLYPMRFYEIDQNNKEIHYNTKKRCVASGKLFTNNGFWDTYKTSFPLYSLLWPKQYAQFLEGFLNSYHETGFLPRWLSPDERGMMPGTMIDAIIADACVKEIAPELMPEFLEAMIHGAETISDDPKYGREGLAEYLQLGYVPCDIHESVNKTLDYAYSDWLISVVANKLGQTEIAQKYQQRSQNYRNLFDPKHNLMHPKDREGNFTADYQSTTWGCGFTEGSAWQNSFAVYQDFPGLIELSGGNAKFAQTLDQLVNQDARYQVGSYNMTIHEMREMAAQPFGQLAISNQPSFHLPYLFALCDQASKTQILVKQLLTTCFDDGFKGYPGDEDNGSMSSWYLFSSLGFYPVTPGSGEYVLGIPLFDKVVLHLPNEQTLCLQAYNNYPSNNFVDYHRLDGQTITTTISHQALLNAKQLEVRLQPLPK